ncbi:hypothetical protein Tco_1330750 [Tanacetum coccineum]
MLAEPFLGCANTFQLTMLRMIILSQEKQIQKLKTLVQSLQEQLQQCGGKDEAVNDNTSSLTGLFNELKQ